jgi:hypothetical protein
MLVERPFRSKYLLPCGLGLDSPGTKRNVIASRFHPLMVMIASVRFTSSSSVKLFVALPLNRFFRTFGANKKRKSSASIICTPCAIVPLRFSRRAPKLLDWDRVARSFLLEAAPKVRKNRFKCSKSGPTAKFRYLTAVRHLESSFDGETSGLPVTHSERRGSLILQQPGRELHCESIEVLPTAHSLSRNDPIMTAFRQRMTDRYANVESRTEHADDLCRWRDRGPLLKRYSCGSEG